MLPLELRRVQLGAAAAPPSVLDFGVAPSLAVKRQKAKGYREPRYPYKYVKERY